VTDEVLDSPTGWVAEHIRSYVASGGEDGHLFLGFPTLLLTTRGRRSGKLRRTPLIYGQAGGRYLLVASNGGSPRHPGWFLNVTANPEVTVQVRDKTFAAWARVAGAEERRSLWPRMVAVFPRYAAYQAQTERELPVVVIR
jgi:deazaflavin-dependent oxidoreductase (nitroreductase family)